MLATERPTFRIFEVDSMYQHPTSEKIGRYLECRIVGDDMDEDSEEYVGDVVPVHHIRLDDPKVERKRCASRGVGTGKAGYAPAPAPAAEKAGRGNARSRVSAPVDEIKGKSKVTVAAKGKEQATELLRAGGAVRSGKQKVKGKLIHLLVKPW
jgi:hypothetical protein